MTVGAKPGRQTFDTSGLLELPQGKLVALVGPKGEGKSTLLKILGGVILPKPECLFIPSHLRVLHISAEPLFFKGTLFQNLTFGVSCEADGKLERVVKICTRLGLSETILELVQQGENGEELTTWNESLSYTQRCLLCLARAFIGNPELMCIHKPTMPFDEKTSVMVFDVLSEYCKNKGVEVDSSTRHMR